MPTPYQKLVPSYPTPNVQDVVYVELVDVSKGAYRPFDTGDLYPDQENFPGFKFLRQEPLTTGEGADKIVRQIWVHDRMGQDAYNAYLKDVQEGGNYPLFIRTYLIARDIYQKGAELQPLKSIVSLSITIPGSQYEGDDFQRIPLIFTGGGGTGATGYAVLGWDGVGGTGAPVALVLTDGGHDYTSDAVLTLAGGDGLFTGVAHVQPQDALLVSEEAKPAEGEMGNLYLTVTRVYHTLPGPTLTTWLWDDQLRIYVRIRKTIVEPPDANNPPPTSDGVIIEYQPIDACRYGKIETSIVYATGGSPPEPYTYPTVVEHYPLPNVILENPQIYYTWAQEGGRFAMDIGFFVNVIEGFSGPYTGRVTEYYTFDPTAIVLPALTQFFPQAHSFGVAWWFASSEQVTAQVVNLSIPQTIHPAFQFSQTGDQGDADVNDITIPATVPAVLPYGQYIVISFTEPRPYKYGLWIYRTLEILVPAYG